MDIGRLTEKYCSFYKGESVLEDVAQSFWYSMFLEKNRLKNNQITRKIQIHQENPAHSGTYGGSKNAATQVVIPVAVKKEYFRNGKNIGTNIDYYGQARCVITDNDNADSEFTCPYCGAIGLRTSFYNGCDYCKTQYQVPPSGQIISSYNVYHDYQWEAEARRTRTRILIIALALISLFLFMISFSTFATVEKAIYEYILKKISFIAAPIAVASLGIIKYFEYTGRKRNKSGIILTEASNRLETEMPEFDREAFEATLDYKLKNIHFAGKGDDTAFFYNKLSDSAIDCYRQVIECSLKNYVIEQYTQDEIYRYIKVNAAVDVVICRDDKIIKCEESVTLDMYMNRHPIVSDSIVSYSCNSCGSSVSLLEGGICSHCHKKIDISAYDWVISEYSSQWINGGRLIKSREHLMKRGIIIAAAIVLLFNAPSVASVVSAGVSGIENHELTVYSFHNEFIPSFSYYGHAILGDRRGYTYVYDYISDYQSGLQSYADELVRDDGFTVVSETQDSIELRRNRRFGWGSVNVTITRTKSSYKITIR